MDPIDIWLNQQKNRPKPGGMGTPAGTGVFGGPAYGASVTPVVPPAPQFTPNPTVPIGGFTPNYGDLIRSDPGYQSGMAAGQQGVAQAAASRRAALQKLAIQFGGLPRGLQDQYGDIDAGTLELAQKNQYSDTQRLQRSYAEGIEAFKRALAARGALQSGETGYGLSQADLARGEREYDLSNQFANAAQGVINDYVGVESRVRQNEAGLLSQAQANVYSNPANRPVDAYDAPLIQGSVEQYGQPLYQGNDGKMYTSSGQPFNPPASAGASLAPVSGGGEQQYALNPATGQYEPVPPGWIFPPGTVGVM